MTTFIDFWIRGVEDQAIDHRAVAESELVAHLDRLDLGEERPLVFLNGDLDWLAEGIPPEWIADLLETIAKYPAADYCMMSLELPHWQSRMKNVAKLAGKGGEIARRWLDGIPPAGLHLTGPSVHASLLSAIPHAPPRKHEPGRIEWTQLPVDLPAISPVPVTRRMPLPHLGR